MISWFDRSVVTRAVAVGILAAFIVSCGGGESTSPQQTNTEPPPQQKNVTLTFCLSDYPIWVAMQRNGADWTRVLPDADRAFRMALGSAGGVAIVWSDPATVVVYASADELNEAFKSCQDQQTVGKTVSGTVAGAPASDLTYVALGPADGVPALGDSLFVVQNVPDGPRDLFAAHGNVAGSALAFSEFILRRGVNIAANGVIPRLDFHSSEAFPAATASVSVANLASSASFSVDLLTASGVEEPLYFGTAAAQQTVVGLPSSRLTAGDLHRIGITEQLPEGTSPAGSRFIDAYTAALTNRTITLGPQLAQPTMTILSSSPYQRWRVLVPVQSDYTQYADMEFDDANGRSIFVLMTRGFATPGTSWDLTMPDFKNTSYDLTWGLQPGGTPSWIVGVFGGDGTVFQNPADGSIVRGSVLYKVSGSADRTAESATAKLSSPRMERRPSLHQAMRARLSHHR
jgi:hypothetical protein